MVSVYFGDMHGVIYNSARYFKNTYTDGWIVDDFCKEMIKDVDKSEVIGPRIIDSPVLGGITPRELSGGVKTLICMYKCPDKVFNASACGDNCAKWILEIGKRKDIVINLRHIMDFGSGEFNIKVLNTDQVVNNMEELIPIAGQFVR